MANVKINYQSIRNKGRFVAIQVLQNVFTSLQNDILIEVKILIREALYNSPEVDSLLDETYGSLKSQFGLTDEEAIEAVDEMINLVLKEISLSLVTAAPKKELLGSILINIGEINFATFSSLPHAKYISPRSGEEIPWMEWLLTKGKQVVVTDWHMIEGNGRAGAIMVPRGVFRVEKYDGTPSDNLITRAIERSREAILAVIVRKMQNAF